MADGQKKVVNGVNTISIHGKAYVEVAERVHMVHEQKREFEVIESLPYEIGDRCLWRVVVLVDGKKYTGNAEVKLKAASGPDKTNPFECGETSALGRALAFAGFGSVESIASYDEVYRATASTNSVKTAHTKETEAEPENKNPMTVPEIKAALDVLQLKTSSGKTVDYRGALYLVFTDEIQSGEVTLKQLQDEGDNLSIKRRARLQNFIDTNSAQAA